MSAARISDRAKRRLRALGRSCGSSVAEPRDQGGLVFDNTRPQKSRDNRDDQLRRLLPSKDSPYDFYSLSQAESDALEEAFSDGFGDYAGSPSMALPVSQRMASMMRLVARWTRCQ